MWTVCGNCKLLRFASLLAMMLVTISPDYGVIAVERHVYPCQSIQAEINIAVNGDVIIVHEGTYNENIDFYGKAITIRSTEPDNPVVADATVIVLIKAITAPSRQWLRPE